MASSLRAALLAVALCCACAGGRAAQVQASPAAGAEQLLLVDGPAGKLRVSDGGSGGTPVVFVHGLGGDIDAWRAQLDHFRRSRRVLAVELRGHGQSEAPKDGNWSVDALAGDLDAATRSLPRFVLVGHSMAGAPLQLYAARHPERLAGLVFVDAVGSFNVLGKEMVEKLLQNDERQLGTDAAKQRGAMERSFGPAMRPATRERVLASLAHLSPDGFLALRRAIFTFAPQGDLPASGIPLLAIEARLDKPVPILFSALAPKAPLQKMANVSHWLMMDDPETFNGLLEEFLRSAAR